MELRKNGDDKWRLELFDRRGGCRPVGKDESVSVPDARLRLSIAEHALAPPVELLLVQAVLASDFLLGDFLATGDFDLHGQPAIGCVAEFDIDWSARRQVLGQIADRARADRR